MWNWGWRIIRHRKWNGDGGKEAISPYDPIDDGWTRHDCVFVCIDCHKAYHPHRRDGYVKICPECKKPTYAVGPYFAAPSRKTHRGLKAWDKIKEILLAREAKANKKLPETVHEPSYRKEVLHILP